MNKLMGTLTLAAFGSLTLSAQSVGTLTPQEKKNQDTAITEMKDILQYGHLELADKVMAPGYIQHNPNVPTGRDAFKGFFARFAKPEPIKDEWKRKPALILTSGIRICGSRGPICCGIGPRTMAISSHANRLGQWTQSL